MDSLLVVHIGAGSHNVNSNDKYGKLLSKALAVTSDSTLFGAVEAAKVLETSFLTNTGYGSSLDLSGSVSCDASFIQVDRNGHYKHYGALLNVNRRCPIEQTVDIYGKIDVLYSSAKFAKLGLSRPRILDFGRNSMVKDLLGVIEEPASLVAEKQNDLYQLYKGEVEPLPNVDIQDTIGVLHVTQNATVLASSSGGTFLKLPGRIGCAGIIGSGIAYNQRNDTEISCMCSGNGDDIVMMSLASSVIHEIFFCANNEDVVGGFHSIVTKISQKVPLSSRNSSGQAIVYVGIIVTIRRADDDVRLLYYHTTETFYFAYKSRGQKHIVLSRLDDPAKAGKTYVVGECIL